ncbi:MAG: aspartate carbamoyltransferase catalytic subunit [Actinomycetota bacterium]
MKLPRHLLSVDDLTRESAIAILDTAAELSNLSDGKRTKLPTLRGRPVVHLFYEDSTRTRISFETAAKRLSADVINFNAKGSSVSKGESLKDTALTLQAMGADAVIIRHPSSGAPQRLADSGWIKGPVINAGDGTRQHPTQALLDAFTIRNRFGRLGGGLDGLRLAIVGDILHSRVARSNIFLASMLGAKVTLIAPPTLLPVEIDQWPVDVSYRIDSKVNEFDIVMPLRIQRERMNQGFFPTEREFSRHYGLNVDRVAKMKPDAVILHPGPMNRGVEIDAGSADSARSLIVDQVANGVFVRMAVLYLLMAGSDHSLDRDAEGEGA